MEHAPCHLKTCECTTPALFLLHINDMLQLSNIQSTGDTLHTGCGDICRTVVDQYQNKLVSEVLISGVSNWGRLNILCLCYYSSLRRHPR
ncbi:unnamed protein product [Pieris macdunnoughi]|uniref:Uncharacterized protein n=1 Tax=Pieris macdunnoughi TaxID=345717 RepID=A0A821PJP1_9NEOP|nr:unnamed protein product [Pieris macdunnoughi]